MKKNERNVKWREGLKRSFELLILLFTIVGLGSIILSIVLRGKISPQVLEILQAMGLTLFPSGVVAFLLSRFASDITEILIMDTIHETMRDRLEKHVDKITEEVTQEVNQGLGAIHQEVKQGAETIRNEMARLSPLYVSCSKLGVEGVYLTRADALIAFAWFLDAEINKAHQKKPAKIWFVSSSIKGFLTTAVGTFRGREMIKGIAESGCDLRIMMTDPQVADRRASQERRAEGEIPKEILMNLALLKRVGVTRDKVRFYPGSPTVFSIATSDRMLLNPYPFETEAFTCFSIIVYKTIDPRSDIYNQYLESHFELPWIRAKEIPLEMWEGL